METACNPKFRPRLYHTLLYKHHVLKDTSVQDPGLPPFYSATFFKTIQKIREKNEMDVALMTECGENEDLLKCRVELANTDIDWCNIWRRIRLPGLGPENISFLFKLVHQILVTQERLSRITPTTTPTCKVPGCTMPPIDDQVHALITCEGNNGVGNAVLNCQRQLVPNLSNEAALRFDIQSLSCGSLPQNFKQYGNYEWQRRKWNCTKYALKLNKKSASLEKQDILML